MPSTPSPAPEDAGAPESETPGAYPHPSYYAYAGTPGSPSAQGGDGAVPMMYPPPPGGYWPPGYMAIPVPMHMGGGVAGPNGKPKRKQVKNACTNCQTACKRCEDARPCSRCVKYGLAESCVNSARKERKKGIKRGPYKKRKEDSGMDLEDPNASMDSMIPPQGTPYHGALPPGYPEGGYYSYFPGYAFPGAPGHLVPASHDGEEGDEDGEEGQQAAAAAAAAAAHYYPHMYPYYAAAAAAPAERKEGEDDDDEAPTAAVPHEEAPVSPVAPAPTPASKKRKKPDTGASEGKSKRGRKKKAAAPAVAAPAPAAPAPPPQHEEDELEPEQEDAKEDEEN